jgi:hypothetical protein
MKTSEIIKLKKKFFVLHIFKSEIKLDFGIDFYPFVSIPNSLKTLDVPTTLVIVI